jgi:hypothetical protein
MAAAEGVLWSPSLIPSFDYRLVVVAGDAVARQAA